MKKNISIEVKVTDRCNQHCFHCVNNDGSNNGEDLDGNHFAKKLLQFAFNQEKSFYRIKEIRMTGGEPLLNLNAVLEIARTCHNLGICTGINTNATLITVPTARLLKEAGLEIVKASFDAIHQSTFRKMRGPGASLRSTLMGIMTAIENGFLVILRLTLCSYNRNQLLDCYRMARDLGIHKLQIKPLVRSGRAIGSSAFLNREEVCQAFHELASVVNGSVPLVEILCWPPEEAAGLPCNVCTGLNKIYFSVMCEASICNYLPMIGTIGNLRQDKLENIIHRRFEICQNMEGHLFLTDCPQSKYFNAIAMPENNNVSKCSAEDNKT